MPQELTFPEIPARVNAGLGQPTPVDGGLATEMVPPAAMYTDDGSIPPGALCVLVDSAIGAAVLQGLGEGLGIVTCHLNIEFVRGIVPGELVLCCTGRLVRADTAFALGEGTVVDSGGDEIAIATVGCVPVLAPDGAAATATSAHGPMPIASSIAELLGSRIITLTPDRCEMGFAASVPVSNLHGGVHGGMGVLMAERTMDQLIRGKCLASSGSQRLAAIRAAYPRRIAADGGSIVCVAETVHRGRRLSMVRAQLHDQHGRPAVIVEATYAATPPR